LECATLGPARWVGGDCFGLGTEGARQGGSLDFVDGETRREETPEEHVRRKTAKSLVREYGYGKTQIAVGFILRLGAGRPR